MGGRNLRKSVHLKNMLGHKLYIKVSNVNSFLHIRGILKEINNYGKMSCPTYST
jgi:hypothetical protein